MLTIASHRSAGIVALWLALAACAAPLFAASCDQPLVSFQVGQLTISSQGCSLQQVLTAAGRQTGIKTQVPASASAVPVFANLGPGNPRQVVSALLDGTPFNWSLATETEADGSRRLVAVVLTERIAPLEPAGRAGAAVQVAANASQKGKPQAGQASSEAALQDPPPKTRAEIDDATLSKLPPLPPGVPSSMWQLFPDVAANTIANGGVAQSGGGAQSGSPFSSTAFNPNASSSGPSAAPGGCWTCPCPPGIDCSIRKLYPPNLMQQIQGPIAPPNNPQPPPPPWARH